MSKYTNKQIIEAARKVVAEKGADYIYSRGLNGRCTYGDRNGGASCIVGQIIHQIDPEVFKVLDSWDRSGGRNGFDGGTDVVSAVKDGILDLTPEQMDALSGAQGRQDNYAPWGVALEYIEGLA